MLLYLETYLPISPYISLYLPISPNQVLLYLETAANPRRRKLSQLFEAVRVERPEKAPRTLTLTLNPAPAPTPTLNPHPQR